MVRMRKLTFAVLRRQHTLDEVKLCTTSLQLEREKEWVSGSQPTQNEALAQHLLLLAAIPRPRNDVSHQSLDLSFKSKV
jgi:hypothetical protein